MVAVTLLSSCGSKPPVAEIARGEALAARACVSCHTLPVPAQLPAEEWPYLLAWMGCYLGHPAEIQIAPTLVDKRAVPSQPLITRAEFKAIETYYIEQSRARHQRLSPLPQPPVSPLFEPLLFAISASVISMVAIDSSDQTLALGTSVPVPSLIVLRRGETSTIPVPSEPATYERLGPLRRVSLIGHLAMDAGRGQVLDLELGREAQRVVVDGYPRIADHRTADMDGDGTGDLLICGFGDYNRGRVGIWWGGADPMQEQILLEEGGAVWGDVADLDGDGDLDLAVSMGNNRPRLLAFVNEGGRRFTPRTITDRPVGWGYNRCLIVDWDADGKKDLVELAGNNLELRGRPMKAHHGVRVLRNAGNWNFTELLFERLDGAIDVAAGDFDNNGRLDLAVVAFCPDWRVSTPTTFLLLLQQADGSVERTGIEDRHWNRWMRIAAGDADGDGDTDLLLGAAQVPMAIPSEHVARYRELLQGKASVLLLRNGTISKVE